VRGGRDVSQIWKPPQHTPTMNQLSSRTTVPSSPLSANPSSNAAARPMACARLMRRTSSKGRTRAVTNCPSRSAVATQPALATDARPSITSTGNNERHEMHWQGARAREDAGANQRCDVAVLHGSSCLARRLVCAP